MQVIETMLYGCVTWSPTAAHLAILRKTHDRLLLRYIGWKRKHGDDYHVLSYADAFVKTGCENVETTVRKRRILEHDPSLFNLHTESKQWMLAAKNSGKWFRRV